MEVNLIRHGYNLQRRKMYPFNPRNNMISTIDMTWNKSLEDEDKFASTKIKNKSIHERQQIKQHYTDLVEKQIETQRSMDKSSFRVLPMQKQSLRYSNPSIESEQLHHRRMSGRRDVKVLSLLNNYQQNEGTKGFLTSREILKPVSIKPQLKSSGNLSRTVFGYEINPQNFKRESYLTKILSDRLQPYLEQATSTHKRHKSVIANQVFDLGY